jgi:polar amino acid transport system substrate-binding protein
MKSALYTRRWVLRSGVGVPLLGFAATWARTSRAETTFEQAKREGIVRVGFANEKPYSYADDAGKLTGEAPAILQYILPKIGVAKFEGVLTEFASLIPGLVARRFDIIGAGMAIRAARCKQIAFANPDHMVGGLFAVPKGNPKKLHSYEDAAKNPSAKLGVFAGTVEVDHAEKAGVPKERLLIFPDTGGALAALQSGRIDAFAATSLAIRASLDSLKDPNLEMAIPFKDPVDEKGNPKVYFQGMGFRMEDADFRKAYNEELAIIRKDGKLLELISPFGFSELNLAPPDMTAERVCVFAM